MSGITTNTSGIISVEITGHGRYETRTDIFDVATAYYASSSLKTLQYTLWDVSETTEFDYSDIDDRSALIVMLCDVTFNDGNNHSLFETDKRFRTPVSDSRINEIQHIVAESRAGDYSRYDGPFEIYLHKMSPEFVSSVPPSILRDAKEYLREIKEIWNYTEGDANTARAWLPIVNTYLNYYDKCGIPALVPADSAEGVA